MDTADQMPDELGNPLASKAAAPTTPNLVGDKETVGDLLAAFAPPFVEILPDKTELTFLPIDMDTWAETTAALMAQRRERAKLKVQSNPQLSPQDREWLLLKLDQELIAFMYAFHYRTQTPEGIKSGLIRQLTKGMKISTGQAKILVARIAPARQREIIRDLADPPIPLPPGEGNQDPNAESASTNETGQSMPPSSNESSESDLGA